MAIFDYKTGDSSRLLTENHPPSEVTAVSLSLFLSLYLYVSGRAYRRRPNLASAILR